MQVQNEIIPTPRHKHSEMINNSHRSQIIATVPLIRLSSHISYSEIRPHNYTNRRVREVPAVAWRPALGASMLVFWWLPFTNRSTTWDICAEIRFSFPTGRRPRNGGDWMLDEESFRSRRSSKLIRFDFRIGDFGYIYIWLFCLCFEGEKWKLKEWEFD